MGDIEASQNIPETSGGEEVNIEQESDTGEDKSIGIELIRKVYLILSAQLGFTSVFLGIFNFYQPAKHLITEHPNVSNVTILLSMLGSWITALIFACLVSTRYSVPTNFILLFVFTIFRSTYTIVSTYCSKHVALLLMSFSLVCMAMTLFVIHAGTDYTHLRAVLWIVLPLFIVFSVILILFPSFHSIDVVYGAISTIAFGIYLIFNTKLVFDENLIQPKEYILQTLISYLSTFCFLPVPLVTFGAIISNSCLIIFLGLFSRND